MAVGTPVHLIAAGATATTATSASFTPSANVRLFALTTGRGGTPSKPTFSDSLGGTWTEVSGSSTAHGNLWGVLFYQDVGASPAARTVTVTSTGSTQVGCEVCEISGTGGAISSNFQVGTSDVGDPSVTMAAYAATSICVAWGIGSAGSAWAAPSGYSEIYDLSPATNVRLNVSYDMVSPGTSLAWASTSVSAIGYGLEIPEAAAGTYTLTANTAAVTLTGTSATLKVARSLSASTAGVTLTGSSTGLKLRRKLAGNSGGITLTGSSADLTYTPASGTYTLTAEPAAVTVTGSAATLTYASSRLPEVNWPMSGPRRSNDYARRKRAELDRYLESLTEKPKPPTKRKVRRLITGILDRLVEEEFLSQPAREVIAPFVRQASFEDVPALIRRILDVPPLSFDRRQIERLLEEIEDELAVAILLAA